ncbi:MAG: cytochrome P450 [Acidobacteria bacterium]|nr:cytochrome P450 [Acidobacteriota bacterium]
MSFLEEYRAASAGAATPEEAARHQLGLLQKWVVEDPEGMFADLRAHQPIFKTPGPVVVTRYRDVIEVVDLEETFSVAPYGVAMMRNNGGPNFILGMDNGPEFEHDLSILHLAVKREDLERIRGIVATRTKELIDAAMPAGRLDITDGFSRLIPTLLCGDYFGVPGPDPVTLMNWVRVMFTDIFLNFAQDPHVSERGMAAGVQFRAHVDALIAGIKKDRENGAAETDDVIGRLITMQRAPKASFTDSRLRDNLIGCVTGVLENTNTAIVNILDWLLDHPDVMAGAVEAARKNDTATLRKYVLETLRFHTPAPLMVRLSVREHTLAKGTDRATTIPAHSVVFAANGSAMMDETELDNPKEFRLDRPPHHYLHWGWGIHQCLGKYISEVQVTEIVKGLLALPNLRRAPGDAGKLTYAGPFPKSFVLEFGATQTATA